MQEELPSIIGTKAPVAPRAHRPGSDARPTLEQLVRPFIDNRARGAIYIVCPAGFGKTTALSHLRAVLPADSQLGFWDEPNADNWQNTTNQSLALVATTKALPFPALAIFELAQWTEDDCLEYLAHTHRDKCANIMKRMAADWFRLVLEGSPAHLRAVMDEMAADDSISIAEALRRCAWRMLPANINREQLGSVVSSFAQDPRSFSIYNFQRLGVSESASQFCAQRAVLIALSAEWAADILSSGRWPDKLDKQTPIHHIQQIAASCKHQPRSIEHLNRLLKRPKDGWVSVAASILLAIEPAWRPPNLGGWNFSSANLAGAQWPRINLRGSDLNHALLMEADLREADLTKTDAIAAELAGAKLRGANLDRAQLSGANLARTDLSFVQAPGVLLKWVNAENAVFADAHLISADLREAILKGCDFFGAALVRTTLINANLEDAKFDCANLREAHLMEVDMRSASWRQASFAGAKIVKCRLEGLDLPNADFTRADLTGSLLTGSTIHRGKFKRAKLVATGLADVDWEFADLRKADFTHASFHMGSSRSGLVGSPIACEGSRTGFYTDEFNEQDYKAPEEIRKANLRGADLRGAKVTDCDFYLVDLRDAKYTPEQADHFAKCGAILFSRAR